MFEFLPVEATAATLERSVGSNGGSSERSAPRTAGELRELERANILQALEQSGWKISGGSGAARILGLAPSTLTSRMSLWESAAPGDPSLSRTFGIQGREIPRLARLRQH